LEAAYDKLAHVACFQWYLILFSASKSTSEMFAFVSRLLGNLSILHNDLDVILFTDAKNISEIC